MTSSGSASADIVLALCRAQGFCLAGIADAAPTAYAREVNAWLEAGKHGEMHYLERNRSALLDPSRILPGVRSVICVADRYHDGRRDRAFDPDQPPRGRVARYARGDDYHRVIRDRLHALCDVLRERFAEHAFRACVDTAPLLEREYAARAGLGAVGKHTLLIEPGVGSWLLLGEVLTTLKIAPSMPRSKQDPCGSCTRCIDACPTDAITPWSVDATRCISYLTIEHRSEIPESFHRPMGEWIFGCDICQDVCPHNHATHRSRRDAVHAAYTPRRDSFDLLEVLGWNEADRRAAFTRSAMKRAKLTMMKRNALIAAGNALRERGGGSQSDELRSRLRAIVSDEQEEAVVRETAAHVLAELPQ